MYFKQDDLLQIDEVYLNGLDIPRCCAIANKALVAKLRIGNIEGRAGNDRNNDVRTPVRKISVYPRHRHLRKSQAEKKPT